MQAPSPDLLSVQKARSLLESTAKMQVSLKDAFAFAETVPHPRLWHELATEALRRHDFGLAIKGFVLKDDYKTVQFVKQACTYAVSCASACPLLQPFCKQAELCATSNDLCTQIECLNDTPKQEAEIHAFFGKYDAALDVYRTMGRLDLAVQMFMRLGHWEQVEKLVKVCFQHCVIHQTPWQSGS
jgi:hypothetical protein